MTSMIPKAAILKSDRRGRGRTPAAQREGLLDAFERSGLSGMKFAALHGVKYPSFANWVQRRRRERMEGAAQAAVSGAPVARAAEDAGAAIHWWEAVVGPEDGSDSGEGSRARAGGLMLHLPGGVRMEITTGGQVAWAAQLLQSLAPAGPPCGQSAKPRQSC